MTEPELVAFQERHVAAARAAGEAFFMGLPDRWYEAPGPKWRCTRGHVSRYTIKSETRGALCPGCLQHVILTFPEDTEALGARVENKAQALAALDHERRVVLDE